MSQKSATERESITFEKGYDELKSIIARLNAEDVSVHEMFEGFRRGKGLEQALRNYLTEREGELTEIERGKNLPEFDIIAPSGGQEDSSKSDPLSLEEDGFLAMQLSSAPASKGKQDADTEIPF